MRRGKIVREALVPRLPIRRIWKSFLTIPGDTGVPPVNHAQVAPAKLRPKDR